MDRFAIARRRRRKREFFPKKRRKWRGSLSPSPRRKPPHGIATHLAWMGHG
jgi:hypothetical protein